jgi:hypothetical protein
MESQLDHIWTEPELIKRFNLPEKDGRSSHVARWVSKGLKCAELVGRRYFQEVDILEFFRTNAVSKTSEKEV